MDWRTIVLVQWGKNHGIISCCEEAVETHLLIAQHVYPLQLELQYKQLISTFTVYVCLRVDLSHNCALLGHETVDDVLKTKN